MKYFVAGTLLFFCIRALAQNPNATLFNTQDFVKANLEEQKKWGQNLPQASSSPYKVGQTRFEMDYKSGTLTSNKNVLTAAFEKNQDKVLTDCYTSQGQELEKAMADGELSKFFDYMNFNPVSVQIYDLRSGVVAPEKVESMRTKLRKSDVPGLQAISRAVSDPLPMVAVLTKEGCQLTTVKDLKEQFAPHINEHKILLARQPKALELSEAKSKTQRAVKDALYRLTDARVHPSTELPAFAGQQPKKIVPALKARK